jgi:hypothetical protein
MKVFLSGNVRLSEANFCLLPVSGWWNSPLDRRYAAEVAAALVAADKRSRETGNFRVFGAKK